GPRSPRRAPAPGHAHPRAGGGRGPALRGPVGAPGRGPPRRPAHRGARRRPLTPVREPRGVGEGVLLLPRRAGVLMGLVSGHGGDLALAALRPYGVDTLFTRSGGHVFPLYDAAVKAGDVRILDVRHEQTATFAAEGVAKLTRRPGVAVLTAGPGVTNGISAVTTAMFNGSPLVVLGGRAPQARWGAGSLQEFDHVPVLRPITKRARTVTDASQLGADIAGP